MPLSYPFRSLRNFNVKVGTKRYMAPELLNETINEKHFDSWKRADVYSVGLVYWEIVRRCRASSLHQEYQVSMIDWLNVCRCVQCRFGVLGDCAQMLRILSSLGIPGVLLLKANITLDKSVLVNSIRNTISMQSPLYAYFYSTLPPGTLENIFQNFTSFHYK